MTFSFLKYTCMVIYLVFVLTILLFIIAFYKNTQEIEKDLYAKIKKNHKFMEMDAIQTASECCGCRSYIDYMDINKKYHLPASCCPSDKLENGQCTEENVFQRGCYEVYENELSYFKKLAFIVIGILLYTHLETIALYFYFIKNQ